MKRVVIFLLLIFNFCTAQTSKDSVCNLQKENEQWKINFQKAQSKPEQLELIKKKILADSVYFDYNANFITREVKYSSVDKKRE